MYYVRQCENEWLVQTADISVAMDLAGSLSKQLNRFLFVDDGAGELIAIFRNGELSIIKKGYNNGHKCA